MGKTEFSLLCMQLHVDPEKIKFKEPPKPAISGPVATRDSASRLAPGDSIPGFGVELQVTSSALAMTITFKGAPLYTGRSKVFGRSELDLIQAISYAAHMCYKSCEQVTLAKKMNGKK